MTIQILKGDDLYRPSTLSAADIKKIQPKQTILGQNRAVSALTFGIKMPPNGYHIFSVGPKGVGRTSLSLSIVREHAKTLPAPNDWCYVTNFDDYNRPKALAFPAGKGKIFARMMNHTAIAIKQTLANTFNDEAYKIELAHIEQEFTAERESYFQKLQKIVATDCVALNRLPSGLIVAPIKDGQFLSPEQFNALPLKTRKAMLSEMKTAQERLEVALKSTPEWQNLQAQKVAELKTHLTCRVVDDKLKRLIKDFEHVAGVREYLNDVKNYLLDNLNFLSPDKSLAADQVRFFWARLAVNPFVCNDPKAGAPVVHLGRPTIPHLLGRIERIPFGASTTTDHSMIRAGALHIANGGILVIEAQELMDNPILWPVLKRVLFAGQIKMDTAEESSVFTNVALDPMPIPLSIKVVLVGDAAIYHTLSTKDSEFTQLFKLEAQFTEKTNRTTDLEKVFIGSLMEFRIREKLLPFAPTTLKILVEKAARHAQDKNSLTMHVVYIHDLMREADFEARTVGAKTVTPAHLEHALVQRYYRLGAPQEEMMKAIKSGTLQIQTDGWKVGQLNSLVIHQYGAFSFGRPSRVTCQIRLGHGKVTDIEREVALGGALHTKGVLILAAYLAGTYGRDMPLPVDASLVMEQSYNEIDGDSASTAELYTLLSAISDVPLNQSIAVTGAINQLGEVLAVGSVNEKIEGYFDVCVQKGLTGNQGVMIPKAGVQSLMLDERVRDAVAAKRFHLWAVDNVDEGIQVLTGWPIDKFKKKLTKRLAEFASKAKKAK
ncbi:MAG: AAA family ATPase [Alphaproteobacteria bacterium]|nr:AAA family ATPase [Alphaproteobacteria bacterium]